MAEQQKLWVVESNGTPRSGKGSINDNNAETFPGAAKDETGIDYRAVTFGLILDDVLDPEMGKDAIGSTIQTLTEDQIRSYASRKNEILVEYGKNALYTPQVGNIVKYVSPYEVVRSAVKSGFANRVAKHVADENTRLLFVDGRNLKNVINTVPGAEILFRQFIDCQPVVAAQREARRLGIDLTQDEHDPAFREILAETLARQMEDEKRENDPVRMDSDAINYWFNTSILNETIERLAEQHRITFTRAATMISEHPDNFRKGGRYGAGAMAVARGRQIYFDTSEVGLEDMLSDARRMVEEALETKAGHYNPYHDGLLKNR